MAGQQKDVSGTYAEKRACRVCLLRPLQSVRGRLRRLCQAKAAGRGHGREDAAGRYGGPGGHRSIQTYLRHSDSLSCSCDWGGERVPDLPGCRGASRPTDRGGAPDLALIGAGRESHRCLDHGGRSARRNIVPATVKAEMLAWPGMSRPTTRIWRVMAKRRAEKHSIEAGFRRSTPRPSQDEGRSSTRLKASTRRSQAVVPRAGHHESRDDWQNVQFPGDTLRALTRRRRQDPADSGCDLRIVTARSAEGLGTARGNFPWISRSKPCALATADRRRMPGHQQPDPSGVASKPSGAPRSSIGSFAHRLERQALDLAFGASRTCTRIPCRQNARLLMRHASAPHLRRAGPDGGLTIRATSSTRATNGPVDVGGRSFQSRGAEHFGGCRARRCM